LFSTTQNLLDTICIYTVCVDVFLGSRAKKKEIVHEGQNIFSMWPSWGIRASLMMGG